MVDKFNGKVGIKTHHLNSENLRSNSKESRDKTSDLFSSFPTRMLLKSRVSAILHDSNDLNKMKISTRQKFTNWIYDLVSEICDILYKNNSNYQHAKGRIESIIESSRENFKTQFSVEIMEVPSLSVMRDNIIKQIITVLEQEPEQQIREEATTEKRVLEQAPEQQIMEESILEKRVLEQDPEKYRTISALTAQIGDGFFDTKINNQQKYGYFATEIDNWLEQAETMKKFGTFANDFIETGAWLLAITVDMINNQNLSNDEQISLKKLSDKIKASLNPFTKYDIEISDRIANITELQKELDLPDLQVQFKNLSSDDLKTYEIKKTLDIKYKYSTPLTAGKDKIFDFQVDGLPNSVDDDPKIMITYSAIASLTTSSNSDKLIFYKNSKTKEYAFEYTKLARIDGVEGNSLWITHATPNFRNVLENSEDWQTIDSETIVKEIDAKQPKERPSWCLELIKDEHHVVNLAKYKIDHEETIKLEKLDEVFNPSYNKIFNENVNIKLQTQLKLETSENGGEVSAQVKMYTINESATIDNRPYSGLRVAPQLGGSVYFKISSTKDDTVFFANEISNEYWAFLEYLDQCHNTYEEAE